jgi:hypothetical protein
LTTTITTDDDEQAVSGDRIPVAELLHRLSRNSS